MNAEHQNITYPAICNSGAGLSRFSGIGNITLDNEVGTKQIKNPIQTNNVIFVMANSLLLNWRFRFEFTILLE